MEWEFECISGDYLPRQFEYHQQDANRLIFGTVYGEVCGVDLTTREIASYGHKGKDMRDAILGLRWMKNDRTDLFLSGSAEGKIVCTDSRTGETVRDYEAFGKLTSVHISCDNTHLLVSGYRKTAHVYDVESGAVVRKFEDIHKDHINISRFANHSPSLLSTSSFDGTVKTWDLRTPTTAGPIYTITANSGLVMVNFSADDTFLLASALDNEIQQYLFVDGRLHLSYALPPSGLKGNFTRAYYSSTGRYTLTGACEERNIKFMCAYTGEYLSSVDMFPGRRDRSLYIQSLRGSPATDSEFCVLANYRDSPHRELVVARGKPAVSADRDGCETALCGVRKNDVVVSEITEHHQPEAVETATEHALSESYLPLSSSAFAEHLFRLRVRAHSHTHSHTTQLLGEEKLADHTDLITLTHTRMDAESLRARHLSSHTLRTQVTPFERDIETLVSMSVCVSQHHIHSFIALARCPALYSLFQTQTQAHPVVSSRSECVVDLTESVSLCDWSSLPLLLDYLYVGESALDVATLRACALVRHFSDCVPRSQWCEEKERLLRLCSSDVRERSPTQKREEETERDAEKERETEVDEFLFLCMDETLWRVCASLSRALCEVLFSLCSLAEAFSLSALQRHCVDRLGDSLYPGNVLCVAQWAVRHKLNDTKLHTPSPSPYSLLYEKCVLTLVRCGCVLPASSLLCDEQPLTDNCTDTVRDNLLDVVRQSRWETVCESVSCKENDDNVLSFPQFRRQLCEDIKRALRSHTAKVVTHTQLRDLMLGGATSNGNTDSNATAARPTLLIEEAPVLYASHTTHTQRLNDSDTESQESSTHNNTQDAQHDLQNSPAVTHTRRISHATLSKAHNHASCLLLDRFLFYFGGVNPDRWQPLSRMLVYDTHTHTFAHVDCGGTHVPSTAHFATAVPLTKKRVSRCVLVGGKIRRNERAECKASIHSNIAWNYLRKTQMSQRRAYLKSFSRQEEEEDEQLRRDLANHPDRVHLDEFDALTCTWKNVRVEMDLRLTREEMINSEYRANHVLGVSDAERELATAFTQRIGGSAVPLFLEDVPYRCTHCLFPSPYGTHAPQRCACGRVSERVCEHERERQGESDETMYALHFGGYCTEEETFMNDLHVLVCERLPDTTHTTLTDAEMQYRYRWKKLHPLGSAPAPRYAHAAVLLPYSTTQGMLSTCMLMCGGQTQGMEGADADLAVLRIPHASERTRHTQQGAFLGTANARTHAHTRTADAIWEEAVVVGTAPRRRYRHTLTHIPNTNICLMFGGSTVYDLLTMQREKYVNDLWALQWSLHPVTRQLEFVWSEVLAPKQRFAPSPRGYHTSNLLCAPVVSTVSSPEGVNAKLFIFGGTDESIRSSGMNGHERVRDSVMHVCDVSVSSNALASSQTELETERAQSSVEARWLDPNDSVMLVEREPAQSLPVCSLSADMRFLVFRRDSPGPPEIEGESVFVGDPLSSLPWQRAIAHELTVFTGSENNTNAPTVASSAVSSFLPDLTILVPTEQSVDAAMSPLADSSEPSVVSPHTHTVASYATLLSERCALFGAMLNSSMREAETKTISLSGETDYHLLVRLIEFVCSHHVSVHTVSDLVGLLNLANEYNVTELVKKCEGGLLRILSTTSVCEILSYADWLDLDLLRTASYAMLLRSPNLRTLLSEEICDVEYDTEKDNEETEPAAEEDANSVSVSEFRRLSVDLKKKFATFARSAKHVARFDVDRDSQNAV